MSDQFRLKLFLKTSLRN